MNPREPRPAVGTPPPRRGLSVSARAWYRRLAPILRAMGVLTLADGPALELLSEALAEYVEARRTLSLQGQSYECTTGTGAVMRRTRPEQAIAADSWRRAAHMFSEFGLTPASRPKVDAQPLPLRADSKWKGLLDDDAYLSQRTTAGKPARNPARFFKDGA